MDAVFLARIQFAITIGFHYIFPVLTIGLAWLIVIFLSIHLKTKDELYKKAAQFWVKIFGICFAMGVASGLTMAFQFGTNWSAYSRFVGDIFGVPLAAEGIMAFFLESTFLGVLLYGEKKVSPRVYWLSAFLVAFGATISAFWIIVANSWQQTPAGFHLVGGRAELVDFWAAVFNPSTLPRYFHAISGAMVAGSFFVLGMSSWYILKQKHLEFAKKSFLISALAAFLSSSLVGFVGHTHAIQVADTQPAKFAAMEGLWEGGVNSKLLLFGIPDEEKEVTHFEIGIPGGLSLLLQGDFSRSVQGLKEFPKEHRPPVLPTFISFHLMVALGTYFGLISFVAIFLYWRGMVWEATWLHKILFFSIPLPVIANELGWMTAEIGRQPWIVYNLMRTAEAVSFSVPAIQIFLSIIMFVLIYSLLFFAWIYLLRYQFKKGPETT